MKRIDYCYYISVEGNAFSDCLRNPRLIETAWGPAVRAEEYGHLYWSEDLYATPCEIDFLSTYLPLPRRSIAYTHFALGGDFFKGTFSETPNELQPQVLIRRSALTDMIRCITRSSQTWAIFVLAYCDDIESVHTLNIEQAIVTIDNFLYDELPELDGGFCVISEDSISFGERSSCQTTLEAARHEEEEEYLEK